MNESVSLSPNSLMIDLHCHSHYSDGLHSPEELISQSVEAGVRLLALTDHDTVAGLAALHQANQHASLTVINGIELSTRWKKYDIHVVGLMIDPHNPVLIQLNAEQNESRIKRAREIGQRLELAGVHNAYQKACDLAGHERVGRPHFAQVLVEEGLAIDRQAAFKRFLGRGRAAYIPTPWLSIPDAVSGIVEAGGQAVLSHPLKYNLTRTRLHELVSEFKAAGGVGIEVVSGEMTVTQVQEMTGLALRYELLASSGSDYHGDQVSRISLGRQRKLPLNCTPIWQQWTI